MNLIFDTTTQKMQAVSSEAGGGHKTGPSLLIYPAGTLLFVREIPLLIQCTEVLLVDK